MRLIKANRLLGKFIEGRRQGIGMAVRSDVHVQIIEHDEQHVHPRCVLRYGGRSGEDTESQQDS